MAFLSFSLTTNELLSGQKTVTRRFWKPAHMANWQRWFDNGRLIHDAYDKLPYAGGRPIARIRLTHRPYMERLGDMPAADLAAEGGMCATLAEFIHLVQRPPDAVCCVVRFELIDVYC